MVVVLKFLASKFLQHHCCSVTLTCWQWQCQITERYVCCSN